MVNVYLAEIPDSMQENAGFGSVQSAAARRLLSLALEGEYPELAGSFRVEKNERGKPFLAGHEDIQISLSHSGTVVACAIAGKAVGVDVEQWKKRTGPERVMRKMHVRERELLESCPLEERERTFYDLWVRKESFLKAVEEGLRLPLDSFCTTGGNAVTKIDQNIREAAYFVRQYRLENIRCSLAVCGEEAVFAEEPVWLRL